MLAVLGLGAPRVGAEPVPAGVGATDDLPGISYLWDGGALPLIWGALAAQVALDRWVVARSTPLGFDPRGGGAAPSAWEVPSWTLTLGGAVVGATFVVGSDEARWYHLKGLAESLAVGGLVTNVLKKSFGRHRPDWTAAATDPNERQSFPSGHATTAFAIATYTALYLHGHVFGHARPAGGVPWWEAAAYAGLFTGAAVLAGERVYHHRHYVSDVVVGSLLGAAESTAAYLYQEARARRRGLTIAPVVTPEATTILLGGTF